MNSKSEARSYKLSMITVYMTPWEVDKDEVEAERQDKLDEKVMSYTSELVILFCLI